MCLAVDPKYQEPTQDHSNYMSLGLYIRGQLSTVFEEAWESKIEADDVA